MTDNNSGAATDQAAAFQKIWMESASRLMQTAFTNGGNSPPPELLRQVRSGIFQALAQSWEEFMRSPEFLEGTRQWMENAISFRKLSNEFLGKVRNEIQAPSRDDVDTIMLTIRHMEKRLLDRLEDLSSQVAALEQQAAPAPRAPRAGRSKRQAEKGKQNTTHQNKPA